MLMACFDSLLEVNTLLKTRDGIRLRAHPIFYFGERACVTGMCVGLAPYTFDNPLINEEEVQAHIVLLLSN